MLTGLGYVAQLYQVQVSKGPVGALGTLLIGGPVLRNTVLSKKGIHISIHDEHFRAFKWKKQKSDLK